MANDVNTKLFMVGETKFWVSRMVPEVGLKTFFDLTSAYGPEMLDMMDVYAVLKGAGKEEDKIGAAIHYAKPALQKLVAKLNGDQVTALKKVLFSEETITFQRGNDAAPQKLNDVTEAQAFQDWAEIVELCIHVFRWNFTDFLARYKARIGSLNALLKTGTK